MNKILKRLKCDMFSSEICGYLKMGRRSGENMLVYLVLCKFIELVRQFVWYRERSD